MSKVKVNKELFDALERAEGFAGGLFGLLQYKIKGEKYYV